MDRSDAPRAERRRLTHVDRGGRPRMVDVSAKPPTARRAVAEAEVAVAPETMSLVIDGGGSKGDVLTVAELAGVMGGKRTSELIPLCHPIALTDLVVSITPDRAAGVLRIRAEAATTGPTGRRDGGDDRGVGRGADRLRHGQGRGARRRDPRPPARVEDRRQERGVASAAGGGDDAARGRGASRATGWPAGSGKRKARGMTDPGARRSC